MVLCCFARESIAMRRAFKLEIKKRVMKEKDREGKIESKGGGGEIWHRYCSLSPMLSHPHLNICLGPPLDKISLDSPKLKDLAGLGMLVII